MVNQIEQKGTIVMRLFLKLETKVLGFQSQILWVYFIQEVWLIQLFHYQAFLTPNKDVIDYFFMEKKCSFIHLLSYRIYIYLNDNTWLILITKICLQRYIKKIQQSNSKLTCQQNNQLDQLYTVCYNQFYTEFRLNCFKCLKYEIILHDHFKDAEKSTLQSLISKIKITNVIILLMMSQKDIESLNQTFSLLKKGIQLKYSLDKGQLVNLNLQQIV
ncbi:unnamed protein product [Paramecium pentaurelia]|uniref:Uncharacterized protein n=1 Tax=Paramecium pentaurelia TaxID=43138 RepID=A0A8S1YQ65_9CILI|nr:unnamed protein product [Paramecium pentaurelia]